MSHLTRLWQALVMLYAIVAISMLIALIRERASVSKFLRWPAAAVAITVFVCIVILLVGAALSLAGVSVDGLILRCLALSLTAWVSYETGRSWARDTGALGFHRRGAVVANADERPGSRTGRGPLFNGRKAAEHPLTLAGLPIPTEDETKHFKLIGTTGTGKSTAIREMLSAALARGDRAVIADPDGGYLSHFYDADRGDVILNPFEPDSAKWNLLDEITIDHDVDQLARSLIPDGGSDRNWNEYARTFFTAVTQQVVAARVREDAEIYRLITKASVQELKLLLTGTMAGPFLEDANERMFGSVRSVTSSAIRALRYTTAQAAMPFSVRQWVRRGDARHNGGRGGVLFFPYKASEIAALASTISAWMRLAIFEAMDQGEGDQRLWFVVDELDALGEIDGLKDALARLRKFGGRCVLGFQSVSQVSSTYGKGAADTIIENCGNALILRCSASEQGGTSQFASRLIGQREVVHLAESTSRRSGEWRTTTTRSEQRSIEPAVMASEIERLPDLQGFLKFASTPDWMRVALPFASYPVVRRRSESPAAAALPAATMGAVAPATTSHPAQFNE
jgi:type IV secretory pathway TraG/TraD family ATPase VirD4